MKDIFLVMIQGVASHNVCGVYSTKDTAIEGCKKAKSHERDDFHDIAIWKWRLDSDVADDDFEYFFKGNHRHPVMGKMIGG